ncbi:MAG: hypothetical protein PW734_08195 [Verrucomicrobium sp.]|nr:hypothetical protein [Verrucomicrobium sp.]
MIWGSAAGLALLLGLGLASLKTAQQEVFPIYSWFLFAVVPNGKTTYQVLIERVGTRSVVPPQFYTQAGDVMGNPHSIVAYKIIQRLGKACRKGKAEEIIRQRALLEANLPPQTTYDVVRIHSDPVEQWRTRRAAIRESVGHFVSGLR